MTTTASPTVTSSSLDLFYNSLGTNIHRYGYLIVMCIGFFGNTCQILTFSRKTMRNVSTGVFFLALSISDTTYLLLTIYTMVIFGFEQTDQSNLIISCRVRHFGINLATNFSAWMLTLIFCDRWIRTQFPHRAQQICTPRNAVYAILVALMIDCLLHVHLLTPLFGPIPSSSLTASCTANRLYPSYVYFYFTIWPTINVITITFLPAGLMLIFLTAIIINIRVRRNRLAPVQQNQSNGQGSRQTKFVQRQMFIMMLMTLILFFVASLPITLYRLILSSLGFPLTPAMSFLLTSILRILTALNYSLNFYLHCLTSTLYRREFRRGILCRALKDSEKTVSNTWGGITTHRSKIPAIQSTVAH